MIFMAMVSDTLFGLSMFIIALLLVLRARPEAKWIEAVAPTLLTAGVIGVI